MSARRSLIPIVLLVGATVVVMSCRDASPLGVAGLTPAGTPTFHGRSDDGDDGDDGEDSDTTDDGDQTEDSLAVCRPLPYDSVTQIVGPQGGEIEVGRNWLIVPRGALREPVSITAVAPSDTMAVIRFRPEGLRFQATALLVATYDNCRVPKAVTLRIALVTNLFRVMEFLAPGDSLLPPRFEKGHKGGHRRVVGQLHHFSNYAVAW
jgi:hypothetical protein